MFFRLGKFHKKSALAKTLADAWAGGTEYGVIFGGLKGFLIHFVSHHSYLCGVEVYAAKT